MSRSIKKTKIRGNTTATSEKKDKQNANRKYRRRVNHVVKTAGEEFPLIRENSIVLGFSKDVKIYDSNMDEKDLKK